MPELPEVETIVRDLSRSIRHKIFSDVIVHDAFLLRQNAGEFVQRLKGASIRKITRRGKAVLMQLSSGEHLVVQVMMTGQLIVDSPVDKHTRLSFNFTDNSRLLYNDQRRFGQLRVVSRLNEVKYLNILGPEPFSKEFNLMYIRDAFQKTIRPVKNVLLDHTFVAGIGNIYACEILYQSRISPKRQACRITGGEIETLYGMTIKVLKEAIKYRGSSMRNYRDGEGKKGRFNQRISVYSRQGLPCPRCQGQVLRIVQAGRSTFYCGVCQK